MNYIEVAEARELPGLRLVLTAHVPGPWGESAKTILDYKGVPYVPVAQHAGQENLDLMAWTGSRNAPVAVFADEAPRTGWYEILMLGERLAPERPLLPARSEARATAVGLSNEICGEWGFGWARRLMMMHGVPGAPPLDPARLAGMTPPPFTAADGARMRRAYGGSPGGPDAAAARCADVARAFATRLHRQRERGSPYLVGDTITACDIHWAVFSMALQPLPHEVNPMPDWMRLGYETIGPALAAAKDPILIAHRDFIYAEHLKLPLDF